MGDERQVPNAVRHAYDESQQRKSQRRDEKHVDDKKALRVKVAPHCFDAADKIEQRVMIEATELDLRKSEIGVGIVRRETDCLVEARLCRLEVAMGCLCQCGPILDLGGEGERSGSPEYTVVPELLDVLRNGSGRSVGLAFPTIEHKGA